MPPLLSSLSKGAVFMPVENWRRVADLNRMASEAIDRVTDGIQYPLDTLSRRWCLPCGNYNKERALSLETCSLVSLVNYYQYKSPQHVTFTPADSLQLFQ